MTILRHPVVAGSFYPTHASQLQKQIRDFLSQVTNRSIKPPKAIIAPHAGYMYSGPIAASAYAPWQALQGQIQRVVLLGPSHRVAFRGIAISHADQFGTPLGVIDVDKVALAELRTLPMVVALEQAHAYEHSLEVQLPFLQVVLGSFQLVPLAVGDATPQEVGAVLDRLWDGPETVIVISSDLSHYHDYATAKQRDAATSQLIEQLNFQQIDYEDACGRNPVNGLLWIAQRKGLQIQTLDLRNSGDTAGNKDRVAGYGAYACYE